MELSPEEKRENSEAGEPLSVPMSVFSRIRLWSVRHATSTRGEWWLGALSFAEATFFPIPPDVLLAAILFSGATRWVRLAAITTLTSVLGALVGYGIGAFAFDTIGAPLVSSYGLSGALVRVGELFSENAFWALFISAFTPIPFKVFTIAGGFFRIALLPFLIASLLGRGLRFVLVAWLTHRFGRFIHGKTLRYVNSISIVFVLLALVVYFIVRMYSV